MSDKIRLAVVAGYPPDAHGEAHYSGKVFDLLASRFSSDIEITVFAHINKYATNDSELHPHVRVKRLTGGDNATERTNRVQELEAVLIAYEPHVVHMQGTTTALYGGLYGEPILPMVQHLKEVGIPTIMTLHSTWLEHDLDELWKSKRLPGFLRRYMTKRYSRFMQKLNSEVTVMRSCVSGENAPVLLQFCAAHGLSPDTVVEESHACELKPVDEARQTAAEAKLMLRGRKLVFAGGFVRPDKGLHHLIAALKVLGRDDVFLTIAGKPSGAAGEAYAKELEEMVSGMKASVRLVFRFLEDDEMGVYYDAASIVAVPYSRAVGASGPIHHAIGRGKTVLASNVGQNTGLKGVIELFEPDNVASLAEALSNILDSDPKMRQATALDYARRHTWEHLAGSYMDDYRRLSRGSA